MYVALTLCLKSTNYTYPYFGHLCLEKWTNEIHDEFLFYEYSCNLKRHVNKFHTVRQLHIGKSTAKYTDFLPLQPSGLLILHVWCFPHRPTMHKLRGGNYGYEEKVSKEFLFFDSFMHLLCLSV